ncbi:hypothetical protein BMYO_0136 [Bifidobacterium myosotis]|uniref:Uncharacterized protein n=1 Tax=Bifidobacterium myosotis TaxID=1630166 RepID=A0A261FR08_9BIFI|nr:hypothetical protein [Bifidobacterium myosotis]OZG61622.1 hypothetical protein BMYO_0136 [Bifidobacterium myosotis]
MSGPILTVWSVCCASRLLRPRLARLLCVPSGVSGACGACGASPSAVCCASRLLRQVRQVRSLSVLDGSLSDFNTWLSGLDA